MVSYSHQIKRNIKEENMRVVTLPPMQDINESKKHEDINNLKQLRRILNFVIRIKVYKTSERIMQCFKCQNFDHKVEFSHVKDRYIN